MCSCFISIFLRIFYDGMKCDPFIVLSAVWSGWSHRGCRLQLHLRLQPVLPLLLTWHKTSLSHTGSFLYKGYASCARRNGAKDLKMLNWFSRWYSFLKYPLLFVGDNEVLFSFRWRNKKIIPAWSPNKWTSERSERVILWWSEGNIFFIPIPNGE